MLSRIDGVVAQLLMLSHNDRSYRIFVSGVSQASEFSDEALRCELGQRRVGTLACWKNVLAGHSVTPCGTPNSRWGPKDFNMI